VGGFFSESVLASDEGGGGEKSEKPQKEARNREKRAQGYSRGTPREEGYREPGRLAEGPPHDI